jgi:hypothetical protein
MLTSSIHHNNELLREIGRAALAMPSDSTALDEAVKQAKREALLETIAEWEKPYGLTEGMKFIDRLRRMAEDLK